MNYFDNKKMTGKNFDEKPFENISVLDELIFRDVTVSIISFFLNVKEKQIWRWEKNISPIPEKHKRKLEEFLKRIKRNPFS